MFASVFDLCTSIFNAQGYPNVRLFERRQTRPERTGRILLQCQPVREFAIATERTQGARKSKL